jgi:hypothetical protein
MVSLALAFSAVAALTGFVGIIYGATGTSDRRRLIGLRLCQIGMTSAGLVMIAAGLMSPQPTDAVFGLLLLAFGTGVTAIGGKADPRARNG